MLDPGARKWLGDCFGSAVRFDEPMARHTSFRIGGPADALIEPLDASQLRQVITWAQTERIPYLILGGGTNLLVRDGGIRGLVIRLNRMAARIDWRVSGQTVQIAAGAGVTTRRLCALALKQGWIGLNFALGIPGSLGGAIMMNAGTGSGCMEKVLSNIHILNADGKWVIIAAADIAYGYRQVCLPESAGPAPVLISAELTVAATDRDQVRTEAIRIMRTRVGRQPVGPAGAGCFFKNPAPRTSAGQLIDTAGFKGVTVGQAQVSPVHANFIVNLGGATADDVLTLARNIQTAVWQRYRIRLEPEVRIVGESADA
jgi:UDP-N-acetylmuramate dehydrogenase